MFMMKPSLTSLYNARPSYSAQPYQAPLNLSGHIEVPSPITPPENTSIPGMNTWAVGPQPGMGYAPENMPGAGAQPGLVGGGWGQPQPGRVYAMGGGQPRPYGSLSNIYRRFNFA